MIDYRDNITKAETFGQLYDAIQAISASRKAGFMTGSTHRHLMVAVSDKLKRLERQKWEQKKGGKS